MAGLHFDITGDNKNFLRKLQEVSNGVKSTAKDVETEGDKMTAVFDKIGKAMGTAVAGFTIKELVSKIAQVRSEFQKLEVSFSTMLGDTSRANDLMAELTRTAAITPFGLQDIASGAKQLLAYGLSADKVNDTLIRLGDISAGLSIPLGDLVYLYGTTMTQGKLFTMDLRQFMGRGIPLAEELAKQFGVTKDEVAGLVTAGRVGFDQVQKAIESMTDAGGKFGGLMEAQSKTIGGQISNLEDAVDSMFNELGKASEGAINTVLSTASVLVENYEAVGKALTAIVATYGTYRAALILTSVVESARVVALRATAIGIHANTSAVIAHTIATKAATVAQAAFNAVANMNPLVLLATIVVGATTALWAYASSLDVAKRSEEDYQDKKSNLIRLEEEHKEKVKELTDIIEDETNSTDIRRKALFELEKKYPDIFAKYKTEEELLKNIKNIKKEIAELDAKTSITKTDNELEYVEQKIKKYEELKKTQTYTQQHTFADGTTTSYTVKGLKAEQQEELNALYKKRGELQVKRKKELSDAYFADLTGISNDELKSEIKRRKDLLGEMALTDKEKGTIKAGYTFNLGTFTKSELEAQLQSLEREQNRRTQELQTPKQYLEELKNQWLEADKAYKDFISNTTTNLDSITYKKKYDELKASRDAAKKAYEDKGGSTTVDKKKESEAKKKAKEEDKYNQVLDKNKRDRERQIRLNELETRQLELNLKEEGTERKIAQIDLDYQKEENAILEWEEELRQTKIDEERKLFEANPINKDKVFDISSVDTSLTSEERALKRSKERVAVNNYIKAYEEIDNAEKEVNAELIRNFGSYAQRKELLEQEHQERLDKIRKTGISQAEEDLENANYQKYLEELDSQFGVAIGSFVDLFEDASEKSVSELQKIIDKYQSLIDLLKNKENKPIEPKDLEAIGLTEQQRNDILSGKVSLKDLTDAFKGLKGELKEKSPFQAFSNSLKTAIKDLKEAKGDVNKMGKGIQNIGNAISTFSPILSKFSSNLASIFGYNDSDVQSVIGAIDGLGQTASGVGQMMAGDFVGGVMSAVSGISSVVGNIESLFGADYSSYNKLKEEYDGLIDVWDKIIAKKREYVSIEYGDEGVQAGKDVLSLIEKEIEAQRKLGKERLNSGASIGSHSIGIRQKKNFSDSAMTELTDALRELGINYDVVLGGRMEGLFDLSAKQLEDLRSNAPTFWAQLDKDVRNYLDNIIDSNEELLKAQERMKELSTGVSFDSVYDNFISTLMDMESDSKDFADNITEYFFKAMLNQMVAQKYRAELENWYNEWSKLAEDGLDEKEQEYLRKKKEDIANRAIEERDALAKTTGYGDSYKEQELSRNGLESFTHEQGDELNGRVTAMQLAGESIKGSMLAVVGRVDGIYSVTTESNEQLKEIRNLVYLSTGYLEDIAKYSKPIGDLGGKLDKIIENTKGLI